MAKKNFLILMVCAPLLWLAWDSPAMAQIDVQEAIPPENRLNAETLSDGWKALFWTLGILAPIAGLWFAIKTLKPVWLMLFKKR